MATWQLQDAKARFSELFRKVLQEGPQRVTRQGGGEVVVLSAETYADLTGKKKKKMDLYEYIRNSPLVGSGIALDRRERGRE